MQSFIERTLSMSALDRMRVIAPLLRLARQTREILGRPAMMRRLLIGGGDADQHRLAVSPAEEIDRDRQRDRFRSDKLSRLFAAVRPPHHRAIIDLARESGGYCNRRQTRIGAETRCERRAQIDRVFDG